MRAMLIRIVYNSFINARAAIREKIVLDVNERSFYPDIMVHIKNELVRENLEVYSVDSEYNRSVTIYNTNKKGVNTNEKFINNNSFDILVHLKGKGCIFYPENLIHIEIKKYNNTDRINDEKRLLSTTRFPNEFSTCCLGMIIDPSEFDSFHSNYITDQSRHIREKQMDWEQIKRDNAKLYQNEVNRPFSSTIAGYQLGAFVDIGINEIKIDYYYSGKKKKQDVINFINN